MVVHWECRGIIVSSGWLSKRGEGRARGGARGVGVIGRPKREPRYAKRTLENVFLHISLGVELIEQMYTKNSQ